MSALRTAAISVRLGMMRLESAKTLTLATARKPLERVLRHRLRDEYARSRFICAHQASHRTTPATPSTATCAPSGIRCVASSTPSTIGNAALARERRQMRGRAAELGDDAGDARQDVAQRRAGDARHQNVARRDAGQLAFAIDHHGAAGAPADAGRMAVEPGMLQPDLVGHVRLDDAQRPRLQQLEAGIVERPFDLDRHAEHVFGLAHQAPERRRLAGFEARRARPALPAPPAAACRRRARRLRDDACGRLRCCAESRGG